MRYPEMENFNRVVRWNDPSHVSFPPPSKIHSYCGAWPTDSRPSGDTNQWLDIWGAEWTDVRGEVFPTGPAVRSINDIDKLIPPDPHGRERRWDEFADQVDRLDRGTTFLTVAHPHSFYEKAIEIMGPQEFLVATLAAPDHVHRLLDMFLEFELGIAEEYARFKPDHMNIGDDYGTQDSLVMDPEMWREFFKPRLKALIDFYRRNVGDHVAVSLHSCGHVMPILEDIIEMGVNILHPVQSLANDLAELRRVTSRRLVLAGGIDGQRVLPDGTPEQVRQEVFRKMDLLWEDGGYLPMDEKRLGVSEENLQAMHDAIREWSEERVETAVPA